MLTPEQLKEVKTAVERIDRKASEYARYYNYYQGKHQLNFASEKFRNKFGKRLQELRENLCRVVVKAPAARLEVINFLADRTNTENPAWQLWKRSKMPLESGKVHREALKTGDAYVIVTLGADGKARISPQRSDQITVWHDDETGEIIKAAKKWKEDKTEYLTIYTDTHIFRYQKHAENDEFVPRNPQNFPEKNPLGRVPVFHFTYDEETSDFGNSILGDVIPLNDALNKAWSDILGAQEENMRRRRFVAGLQVEKDEETGRPINPFKPDDDVWFSEDTETKFGEFSDADLTQMIEVKKSVVMSIALVSGIPPSYFNLESTGSAISGEALRKLEARFIAIIQDCQRSFGETWAKVINFALRLERTAITEGQEIETQWADAAPVSESEILDNAQKKKNLGWSLEQIQRDYGLSDEQIEKMKAENSEREQAKVEQAARFFDSGGSLINE